MARKLPQSLIGTGVIAQWYGVQYKTVDVWRTRYPDFPQPDYWVETAGAAIPAWREDRRPEFDAWYNSRPGFGWRSGKKAAP